MRTTFPWLGALLVSSLFTCVANAQYPMYAPPTYPFGQYGIAAPDMCGPGFYATNCCGAVYGPNYCVRPPFPPYNGERPCLPKQNRGAAAIPTHPFAHGPRDYFMLD